MIAVLKKGLVALILLAVAFVAGMKIAGERHGDDVIVDSHSGKGYGAVDVSSNVHDAPGNQASNSDDQDNNSADQDNKKSLGQRPVLTVNQGQLIQDAVKRAKPGDTIQVMPGDYSETVYIDKDDIRLIGVIQQGKRATLDGKGKLNDAILYSGNNIVVEGFQIIGYKGNAIMGQAGNNFEIRNNIIKDTGVYGIFPQLGKNGIVEHNIVSGIEDAAIYIGMSDNVHVAHNDVFDSVAGIEIENSRYAVVENNYVHNNTGGILAFITPGLPIKDTHHVIIRNNFVIGNNHANFGAPGSTVSGIPAGTGMLIMAADDVVIEGNIISDNKTAGVLITDHQNASNITFDPDVDPNPDRVAILDNVLIHNGYDTINVVKALMLSELKTGLVDIVSVGGGADNCVINRHRYNLVGLSKFKQCDFTNTDDIDNYLLDTPVPARVISADDRGKIAYLGVCSGCHSYTGRLIGPPVQVIQALYLDNPEGLAQYISQPVKKRPDFPEMPPQAYLGGETIKAVAEYMLQLKE